MQKRPSHGYNVLVFQQPAVGRAKLPSPISPPIPFPPALSICASAVWILRVVTRVEPCPARSVAAVRAWSVSWAFRSGAGPLGAYL